MYRNVCLLLYYGDEKRKFLIVQISYFDPSASSDHAPRLENPANFIAIQPSASRLHLDTR